MNRCIAGCPVPESSVPSAPAWSSRCTTLPPQRGRRPARRVPPRRAAPPSPAQLGPDVGVLAGADVTRASGSPSRSHQVTDGSRRSRSCSRSAVLLSGRAPGTRPASTCPHGWRLLRACRGRRGVERSQHRPHRDAGVQVAGPAQRLDVLDEPWLQAEHLDADAREQSRIREQVRPAQHGRDEATAAQGQRVERQVQRQAGEVPRTRHAVVGQGGRRRLTMGPACVSASRGASASDRPERSQWAPAPRCRPRAAVADG